MNSQTGYFSEAKLLLSQIYNTYDSSYNISGAYFDVWIQLQSDVDSSGNPMINQYEFGFVDTNGNSLLPYLYSFQITTDPNPMADQIADEFGNTGINWVSQSDPTLVDSQTDGTYPSDLNFMIAGIDSNTLTTYRFIFDISSQSDITTIFNGQGNDGLIIYGTGTIPISKLAVGITAFDCSTVISEFLNTINNWAGDTAINSSDITQIKQIITGNACNYTDNFNYGTISNTPIFKNNSYDMSRLDSLICYLTNKIENYKLQLVACGPNACFSFAPCLLQSIKSLITIKNNAQNQYATLYKSYGALLNSYNYSISALNTMSNYGCQLETYTTNWIINNIDPNFNLANITCTTGALNPNSVCTSNINYVSS